MNWLMIGALLLTLAGIDIDTGWSDADATETAMAAEPAAGTMTVQYGGGGIPSK